MIETGSSQDEPLKLRNTVAATNLSAAVKQITIPSRMDDDGRSVPASPVFPVDPNQDPIVNQMPCTMYGSSTLVANQAQVAPVFLPITGLNGLVVAAQTYYYNPTSGVTEPVRTPTVYKNVLAVNAGSTAVWTAAVGKRWRLMGICVTLIQATTAEAGSALKMLDVAADTGVGVTINVAALAAVVGNSIILQASFSNGIMAAATNTALNVSLSTGLAVNGVSVQVWGTEE